MFSHILKNSILRGAAAILLAVGACVSLPSCSDDIDLPGVNTDPVAGYINLTLKCSDNISRAQEPGVDDLNENRIFSVTLCLSPYAGDRTPEDAPLYFNTFSNLDANGQVVLRIPLDSEMVTRLFGESGNNKCHAFAAVNVTVGDAKTEAELRRLVVNSTFETRKTQSLFTMDGDGTIEYTPQGNYAVGNIDVQRSAAKITLALDVDDEVEEVVNGETLTWRPNPRGMYVFLQQGVKTSNLDPMPTPNMDSSVYFNSATDSPYQFKTVTRPADDQYARYDEEQEVPFYTYPNKWTGNLDEAHGTYMMLAVPWSADGGQSWRTCYYHVPIIPNGHFDLTRNISYHVFLHVGVLGSFVPDEPLEIEGDYYVADWGQENIPVDIKDYRYLVVDQNDFVVNNEPDITIPFYTSHPTMVTEVKMTFYRYNFSDQGSEFAVPVTMAQNRLSADKSTSKADSVYVCEFNNDNNTLYLNHSLNIWVPYNVSNNEVNLTRRVNGSRADIDNVSEIQALINTIAYFKEKANDSEYSRIEYEVTVQHQDVFDGSSGINKDLYKETVRITQYPGMYITAVQNYCDNLANKDWTNATSGNTLINNNTNGDAYRFTQGSDFTTTGTNTERIRNIYNYRNWDRSIGLGFPPTYFNWNPNMYLVTITQLSQELGQKYIIDDPRSYNINNDLSNNYGNYTVDGGTTNVFKNEYWVFSNRANGYQGRRYDSAYTAGTFTASDGKTYDVAFRYTIPGFVTAKALGETGTRTLKYYYPTREDESNKYTIAPKFRICSSYAGTSGYLTREMSRRRAAAYQEMGYCAGRWRLPTFGEVEYIMLLAAQQKIPRLFGTNDSGTWYYWCAQGAVAVPAGNAANQAVNIVTPPTNASSPATIYTLPLAPFSGDNFLGRTRFVYDEWYWGEGTLERAAGSPNSITLLYEFTWGDQQKSNPEN